MICNYTREYGCETTEDKKYCTIIFTGSVKTGQPNPCC